MKWPRIKLAGKYALQEFMVVWQSAREMKTEKPFQSAWRLTAELTRSKNAFKLSVMPKPIVSRRLLKKSLFKNRMLCKWDVAAIKRLFPCTFSQKFVLLWQKVGRKHKLIFRVGAFS